MAAIQDGMHFGYPHQGRYDESEVDWRSTMHQACQKPSWALFIQKTKREGDDWSLKLFSSAHFCSRDLWKSSTFILLHVLKAAWCKPILAVC